MFALRNTSGVFALLLSLCFEFVNDAENMSMLNVPFHFFYTTHTKILRYRERATHD